MANGVFSSFLFLRCFNRAKITDTIDLGFNFLISFFGDLGVDHGALSCCVFDTTWLFLLSTSPHAEIRSIQIVLRHLGVIVKNSKLIVLFGLQSQLFLWLRASETLLGARTIDIVLLLNVLGDIWAFRLDQPGELKCPNMELPRNRKMQNQICFDWGSNKYTSSMLSY